MLCPRIFFPTTFFSISWILWVHTEHHTHTHTSQVNSACTYIHNEEVQPTPGISEVLDEAVGHPLQQHLQDEDVGENPISVLQNDFHRLPLFNVHVLKGLEEIAAARNTDISFHVCFLTYPHTFTYTLYIYIFASLLSETSIRWVKIPAFLVPITAPIPSSGH